MYQTRNITFRCYEIHGAIVERAAERAGKSLSDYCRDIMIPWAASDLGETLPPMPRLERGRHASMIAKAAKAVGLTPEQFERRAAEQAAAAALGMLGPDEAESGERRAQRPGLYTEVPAPSSERIRRATSR